MPYSFALPTTSALLYSSFLQCDSHPTLIPVATVQRSVVRSVLKKHKRLPLVAQASNLTSVLAALDEYIPYLLALDSGLASQPVGDEEVDVILLKEIEVEWRPCITSSLPGRDVTRVMGKGLDYEIAFVLTTLAYTNCLLGRLQLHTMYTATTLSPEQRKAAVTAASKYFLQAYSIHQHVMLRSREADLPALDVTCPVQSALAAVAFSEATLLLVLKDDYYPAIVAQGRNQSDREWMIKAPEIPKVRAHLFARLSLSAAEHAGKAYATLSTLDPSKQDRIDSSLIQYTKDLQRTARAKACRFLGIDAELGGNIGEAIAWLILGKKELGFKVDEDDGARINGLAKLKKEWTERREDKKVEKGGEWGSDAGRLEEARVIEWLEKKWNKENDLIGLQQIPPADSLLTSLPLSREINTPQPYVALSLDEDTLARMRAPVKKEGEQAKLIGHSDDSDEENTRTGPVPGDFPRTASGNEGTYF